MYTSSVYGPIKRLTYTHNNKKMNHEPAKYVNWAISGTNPRIRVKNLHRNFQIAMKTIQFVFIKMYIKSLAFTNNKEILKGCE